MSRRLRTTTAKTQQVVYAEGATLPTLGAAGFSARVNAYVVGQAGSCADGETDLWYLSLVGARGQEASLRALWANLVSNRPHRGYSSDAPRLGEVGRIALGHTRKDLLPSVLGWRIHWNWHLETVPPGRDKHAILEPDVLTCHDPTVLRDLPAMTIEELEAVKRQPCFLLLVRREDTLDPRVVPLRHLRFLSTRIAPLAYYPPFAAYLWERAVAEGEVEPLRVWCYDPSPSKREKVSDEETQPEASMRAVGGTASPSPSTLGRQPTGPVLVAAYLCRPQPGALMRDLQRAIGGGLCAGAGREDNAKPETHDEPEAGNDALPRSVSGGATSEVPTGDAPAEEQTAPSLAPTGPAWHSVSAGAARDTRSAVPNSHLLPPMLAMVREIVAAAGQAGAFERAEEFCLKIPNPPYLDLVIEAHALPGNRRMVTVTHYLPHDDPLDDLITDSDAELTWDGTPISLTVRGPYGPHYTRVPDEPSPHRDRALADVETFLRTWAVNLAAQGFVEAATRLCPVAGPNT